ncbi:MAG TPA: transcription-repair coupling factor [Candidatus Omnitrophica bacterium]|nr:transcription-repair coupling factor [Candidatus Omnitrophota bacterium]
MEFNNLKIYKGKVTSLPEIVKQLVNLGYRNLPELSDEGDFRRRGDVLDVYCVGFEYPVRIEWDWDKISKIRSFDPQNLIFFQEHEILIILPKLKKALKRISYYEELPLQANLEIKKNDFVVHLNYGIGRYLGRKKLSTPQGQKEFLEIEYENKEKLYLPIEKTHLIQKYVNLGGRPPKLSRLGTREWIALRERVRKSVKRYAWELLREQALRELLGGFSFSKDSAWQEEFEKSFPYQETPDQIKALKEVKEDMESNKAMDRLICGDVGYGKTEVAMRAAFKAVMDSKQVAFLVPTTILAEQHYQNFLNRVKNFPVRVEMLSRFVKPTQQKKVIEDLKKGLVDVVIGTHRLLSPDTRFKDLGLLIIDEEQRFGVKQKEKIKKMKVGVDVLTLTATPIPRTLYIGLSGVKAISTIKTPPKERLSVKTYVEEFNKDLIRRAILKEYNRGGQIFFVESRIEDLKKTEKILREILPSYIKIGVAFGKMRSSWLEKVMLSFINSEIHCLLSTAIIESGIDIPKANTLIVNNAQKFGLSDLHQLRGRVGRFNIQAYAYFLVPNKEMISLEAKKRLQVIKEYSHLGAGFALSLQDLEIRGAGNILGEEQHGFIWQIGLDLYCRLLKSQIEELRGEFNISLKR